MKNGKIWYLIGFVVVLGLIWYFFQNREAKPEATTDNTAQQDEDDAMAGWQTYSSGDLHFSIKHPEAVSVHNDGPAEVGLRLTGATQGEGTEMTDGLSMSFRKVTKGGSDTLQAMAQSNLDQISEFASVKQAPTAVTLAGKAAVTYRYAAMGDFTVYLVQVSDTQVLEISYMSADPQNKGYVQMIKDMLSTLVIN